MIPLKYVCAYKSLNVPQSFSPATVGVRHRHLSQVPPTDHSDWMQLRLCGVCESLSSLYHSQPIYFQQSQVLPTDHSDWMPQRQHGDCRSFSSLYHSQLIYNRLSQGHPTPTDHSDWILQRQCGVCGSLSSLGCLIRFRTTLDGGLPISKIHIQTLILPLIPQRQHGVCGSFSSLRHHSPQFHTI